MSDHDLIRAFLRQPAGMPARERVRRVAMTYTVSSRTAGMRTTFEAAYPYAIELGPDPQQVERMEGVVFDLVSRAVENPGTWSDFANGAGGGGQWPRWNPASMDELDDILSPARRVRQAMRMFGHSMRDLQFRTPRPPWLPLKCWRTAEALGE